MQYSFKKLNLIVGWLSFVLASTVYLLTMEPTASFWDCSEFIATSYKLEVGHPPGAPLFMMISRFFTMFGGPRTGGRARQLDVGAGERGDGHVPVLDDHASGPARDAQKRRPS